MSLHYCCTLLLCVATCSLLVWHCLEAVRAEIGGSVRVGVMESCVRLESCGGGVMASGVSKVCQRSHWGR